MTAVQILLVTSLLWKVAEDICYVVVHGKVMQIDLHSTISLLFISVDTSAKQLISYTENVKVNVALIITVWPHL